MAASSGKELKEAVLAQFASEGTSAAESLAKAAFVGFKAVVHKSVRDLNDAGLTGNTHLSIDGSLGVGIRITSVQGVIQGGHVSDNTDFCSMQLVSNNGNGGADTVIATANTTNSGATAATGTITEGIPFNFTLTDANVKVATGRHLQLKLLKYGSGTNINCASFIVKGDWE